MAKANLPKRIIWTVLHLASEPRWAWQYVRDNLVSAKSPLDLKRPWFSYGAINWLESNLSPEMTVVEFGAGGSSLFFARHCDHVRSYEHDPAWAELVRSAAMEHENLDLILVPTEVFEKPAEWLSKDIGGADVVVIDCMESDSHSIRPRILRLVDSTVHAGGIVVVDDSWRYRDAIAESSNRETLVFAGLGPGRRGSTETAILIY